MSEIRYYNGPRSDLMDLLYDRIREHNPFWESIDTNLAAEIMHIEKDHQAVLASRDAEVVALKERVKELEDEAKDVDAAMEIIKEKNAKLRAENARLKKDNLLLLDICKRTYSYFQAQKDCFADFDPTIYLLCEEVINNEAIRTAGEVKENGNA